MTQPDIYTIEARRRLAAEYEAADMPFPAADILRGTHSTTAVNALAVTLRELNWQPPVDPDLVEARRFAVGLFEARHFMGTARECELGNMDETPEVVTCLAAIQRGRALGRGS